jgi:peptide/nickel transport system substrate-binding protein
VTVLDPRWSGTYATRGHGYLVYDTLFGMDGNQVPSPQMVETVQTEDDGRRWTLTLRPGLRFHDGDQVLARDCVASIRRWSQRDPYGGTLMAATDELIATDDRTLVFRLKRPFVAARSAWQGADHHAGDDAGAAGTDRSCDATGGSGRLWSVPLQGG